VGGVFTVLGVVDSLFFRFLKITTYKNKWSWFIDPHTVVDRSACGRFLCVLITQ
jgi:hypothetical protein